jgi:hypothetical protein
MFAIPPTSRRSPAPGSRVRLDRLRNRRSIPLTLMGMESPDTRRKADDSYRARSAGRSMRATGLVALTEGDRWQDSPHLFQLRFG